MILVGQRGDHTRVAGFAIEQGADEDHLRAGFSLDADRANGDGDAFAHRGDVFGRDRQIDPDVVEIDDDEKLALLAFTPDQAAEVDAPFRDAAGDRRAKKLLAQRFRGLIGQVGDFILGQAERKQFLPGAVELDLRIVGGELGAKELVLRNGAGFIERLLAGEQGLAQVIGQARREILALGIGDLAALDHGDNLAFLDAVTEALAQLRHGGQHAHRYPADVIGVRDQGTGRQEVTLEHTARDAGQRNAGIPDLLLVEIDALGAVMFAFGFRRACRRGVRLCEFERQRPSGPQRGGDNHGDADGDAGEEDSNPFHRCVSRGRRRMPKPLRHGDVRGRPAARWAAGPDRSVRPDQARGGLKGESRSAASGNRMLTTR